MKLGRVIDTKCHRNSPIPISLLVTLQYLSCRIEYCTFSIKAYDKLLEDANELEMNLISRNVTKPKSIKKGFDYGGGI